MLGEVVAAPRTLLDLGLGFDDRLAHLLGDERAVGLLPLAEARRHGPHAWRAIGESGPAPVLEGAAGLLECRLDLRWIDHGYGHYLTHVAGGGMVDWRDMVKFHVMNTLTFFDYTPPARATQGRRGRAGRRETLAREVAIAREIAGMPGLSAEERVRLWEERTKLSRPTYYRRLEAGCKNH